MAEYINRRKAAEVVCKLICGSDRGLCVSTSENCQQEKMLEFYKIPAEDVAPVVHGNWILDRRIAGGAYFKCSICGRLIEVLGYTRIEKYPYCHCGARMDGGE